MKRTIQAELTNSIDHIDTFLTTLKRLELRVSLVVNETTSSLRNNSEWRIERIRNVKWRRSLPTARLIDTVIHYIVLRGAEFSRSIAASREACEKLLNKDTRIDRYFFPFITMELNGLIKKMWFLYNLQKPLRPFFTLRNGR